MPGFPIDGHIYINNMKKKTNALTPININEVADETFNDKMML